MRGDIFPKIWSRLVRFAALGAGILVLAGCVTGYSYVRPNAPGSGGYYTSATPYTGQGYYDAYGTGPYYPGTSAWGYYNGSFPPVGAFGYYRGGYIGYSYLQPFAFSLGISNVWNFPGYWGPWYSTTLPVWRRGCRYWRCNRYHYSYRHRQPRHTIHPRDLGVVSARPSMPSSRVGTRIKPEVYSVRHANARATGLGTTMSPAEFMHYSARSRLRASTRPVFRPHRAEPALTHRSVTRTPVMPAARRSRPTSLRHPSIRPPRHSVRKPSKNHSRHPGTSVKIR